MNLVVLVSIYKGAFLFQYMLKYTLLSILIRSGISLIIFSDFKKNFFCYIYINSFNLH